MTTRSISLGLAGALLLAAGCGDSTDPDGGGGIPVENARLQVRVQASGDDIDDTVTIALDGGTPMTSSGGGTITYAEVPYGRHSVEIGSISKNCSVAGGELRTIDIADPSVTFAFELSCSPLVPPGGGGGAS